MPSPVRRTAHAALIAGLYVTVCHLQNLLLPGAASFGIQFRLAEALCVLSWFTPAAIPGLTLGCMVFNLTFAGALPLDIPVGALATFLAVKGMRLLRSTRPGRALGLLLPGLWNGLLVGWELAVFLGEGPFSAALFFANALAVALGETGVMLTLGLVLGRTLSRRDLGKKIFR